jgi:hypothetical protein
VGRSVRSGLSLSIRCPNVALDKRLEALALLPAAAHRVRVHPQRKGRVGVAELPHHVGRVPADRWWTPNGGYPLGHPGYAEGLATNAGGDFRYLLQALGANPGSGTGLSSGPTPGSSYYPTGNPGP